MTVNTVTYNLLTVKLSLTFVLKDQETNFDICTVTQCGNVTEINTTLTSFNP